MMRTAVFTLAALLTCVANADGPVQHPVTFELGPKAFRDGDVVQITRLTSTSPRLEQGDTVTVAGRVRIDSTADARLCLYLTQTQGDGIEETDATQEVVVKRGLTEFELTTTIKHQGVLHLTLYRTTNGKAFGGVYFGTPDQLRGVSRSIVDHYLED